MNVVNLPLTVCLAIKSNLSALELCNDCVWTTQGAEALEALIYKSTSHNVN